MKRLSKFVPASAATILVLAAVVATANTQNPRRRMLIQPPAAGRAMLRAGLLLRGLDLSAAQREQVKGILETHKAETQAALREQVEARGALARAVAEGASEPVLKASFDQVTNAEWNVVQNRSRIFSECKQILTAEQLARLQERLRKVDARI